MNLGSSDNRVRPRDFAQLLLAAGDLRPRQRARDQQADRLGLALKRQVLERLQALDPEPADIVAALSRIVDQLGNPTGPTRALVRVIYEEWQAACADPALLERLLDEAVNQKP